MENVSPAGMFESFRRQHGFLNWQLFTISPYSVTCLVYFYNTHNSNDLLILIKTIVKELDRIYGRKRRRSDSVLWQNPYTHRIIQKATWQHKNATKNFDYTTIADRLRTVSWSNSSHPTGVVKPVYERSTFPLSATAVQSKGHTFKNLLIILLIETEDQHPTKAERS